MALWDSWVSFIINLISFLSTQPGISEALAIILFTFCIRLLIFPISYRSAYNMYLNKRAMDKIKPRIEKLKQRYQNDPAELAKKTMGMYKENGIKLMDKVSFYNLGLQGTVGLGMFQALRQMPFVSKFLWIENIARPDVMIGILVGILTLGMMLLSPGASDQLPMLITMVIISTIFVCSFPSAIGIYLVTSNSVSIIQTIVLRRVIARQNAELIS